MIHYLDTSALVKRYVAEPGSTVVRSLFRRHKAIAVAHVAYAELAAAVARLCREEVLIEDARDSILGRIDQDFGQLTVLEIRPRLSKRTADLVLRAPLRGYDAVHLAVALAIREQGGPVNFWSRDAALLDAARSHGLRTTLADPG